MGNLSEKINEMIKTILESSTWTSAGQTKTQNFLAEFRGETNPDLDEQITKQFEESDIGQKVDSMEKGNLGDIQGMSTKQFGNVRALATNPFGFIIQTILLKLKTGVGILFIVAIAVEVAKFLILEMFKPGRPFDIRFRERIDEQIIKFFDRKEQQEFRQGFKSIITTTIGGLRGDSLRGQIGGNFYSGGDFGVGVSAYDPSRVTVGNINKQDMRKKSFQDVGAAGARSRR